MHWDCHDVFNESSIKLTLTFIRTPDGHYNVQWKEKQSLLWIVLTAATVNMVNPPHPTHLPSPLCSHAFIRSLGVWSVNGLECVLFGRHCCFVLMDEALEWQMAFEPADMLSHTRESTHTLSSKHRPQASQLHRERMVSIGICVSIGLQVYRTSEDKCISIIFTWQVFVCLFIWLTVWNEIEKAQSFNHWASTATFFHGNVTCQSTLVGRKHF